MSSLVGAIDCAVTPRMRFSVVASKPLARVRTMTLVVQFREGRFCAPGPTNVKVDVAWTGPVVGRFLVYSRRLVVKQVNLFDQRGKSSTQLRVSCHFLDWKSIGVAGQWLVLVQASVQFSTNIFLGPDNLVVASPFLRVTSRRQFVCGRCAYRSELRQACVRSAQ